MMLPSLDVNNRGEFNESIKKGTNDAYDTLCSIIKDELIVSDDSDYIDVCTKDKDSFDTSNDIGEIVNITNNSGEAKGESFVEKCDSDAKKTVSNNSTIDHVYNDKKILDEKSESKNLNEITCTPAKLDLSRNPVFAKVGSRTSRKRKRQFSTKNLYKLYCLHCDRTQPKISGKDRKKCVVCNEKFQFECLKCCKRYNSYIGIYLHLKNECTQNFGFERSDKQLRFSSKERLSVDLETNNNEQNLEYSQLCLNCGIRSNESMNQIGLCKTTKSFTCSACSFKCCSKRNLEYHIQNDHKISMKYHVNSVLKEKEMSKSMNNSLKETSPRKSLIVNRRKDIELYCRKCDNISKPTRVFRQQEICALCNTYAIYQCRLCKKKYTHRGSIYKHLKNDCINIEPQYKCSQCDYKAKRNAYLQLHVERKHTIKKCTRCSEIFKNAVALRQHQLHKCSNKSMLKCNCCSYKTIFETQLKKHIHLEHNSRYTCSQCGKKYMNLKYFNNHQKYDCGFEIHYECNHCSYSTNLKGNLKNHIKSQHPKIFLFGDSL